MFQALKLHHQIACFARPFAVGTNWFVGFSNTAPVISRNIEIKSETAPDESHRLKATVPDAIATGSIIDEDVGDKLLIGMALGPPSSVVNQRSFLEANVPQSWHGVVVIPRADDLAMRLAPDGFVIVRPTGLALSTDIKTASAAGFQKGAPGFIDFSGWRLGATS